jgi:UDP-glucose 4-epimerase
VFGKYEAWEVRFISNAICRVLFDLPILIRQNVRFDYLHVDDVSKLTAWFIENEPTFKTYNVCRGETYDLHSLAQMVASASGRNPEIRIAQPGLAPEYSGNNQRLRAELCPSFELIERQIQKLYQWYAEHRSSIDPAALRFDG